MIFTRVEGLLREGTHAATAAVGDPLRFLARRGVPVVLVSAWQASEIRRLQHECAFSQPFICEDGAALYVPGTWLHEPASPSSHADGAGGWEVFRFSPPSVSAAVRLASEAFVARGHNPLLTVGIGCDLADYTLLMAVDVPIVVRGRSGSQPDLLLNLPGVYVTSASGADGWSEAVLGAPH